MTFHQRGDRQFAVSNEAHAPLADVGQFPANTNRGCTRCPVQGEGLDVGLQQEGEPGMMPPVLAVIHPTMMGQTTDELHSPDGLVLFLAGRGHHQAEDSGDDGGAAGNSHPDHNQAQQSFHSVGADRHAIGHLFVAQAL